MAHSKGAYLGKPQGDRRLAPAQVAAIAITVFLGGIAATGGGFNAISALALSCAAALVVLRRSRFAAAFIPLACLAGIFYYHFYFLLRAERISVPVDSAISFAGTVASDPGHSAKSEHFTLRLAEPFQGDIKIVASPGSGFKYGDVLALQGQVKAPEIKRDLPVAIFPKIERIEEGKGQPVRQALSDLKHKLLEIFPRYLPSPEAAFLGGITLGARADFSPEFTRALASSGTTHLVALSGYNIAILVLVVFGGCLWVFGRKAAFYVTTLALLLFVAMVGAEPSVVRAAAMGFAVLLARELGRPYGLPYALLWTAFFMVLLDPGSLFMPGFQLSFMSLLGIVYVSPVILKWLGGAAAGESLTLLGGLRENAALTIAAQVAVAPIALYNFDGVSATSFIANSLILPFMPLTMFFGFMLLACGLVFPPLCMLLGLISHVLLGYEISVINFFAAFPVPITAQLPAFGIVIYYLLLAMVARRHQLRENER